MVVWQLCVLLVRIRNAEFASSGLADDFKNIRQIQPLPTPPYAASTNNWAYEMPSLVAAISHLLPQDKEDMREIYTYPAKIKAE